MWAHFLMLQLEEHQSQDVLSVGSLLPGLWTVGSAHGPQVKCKDGSFRQSTLLLKVNSIFCFYSYLGYQT